MNLLKQIWLQIKLYVLATHILIAINVFMFLASLGLMLYYDNFNVAVYVLGANNLSDVLNGEFGRLILNAFLHGGIWHLLFNMTALYNIGGVLERFYGGWKVMTIYVIGALGASVVSLIAQFVQFVGSGDDMAIAGISVGASGAIFAMIGIIVGSNYKSDTYSQNVSQYVQMSQIWMIIAINLFIGFGFNTLGFGISIDNWAHLGGLITGIALGLFLEPLNSYYKESWKKNAEYSLAGLSLLLVLSGTIVHIVKVIFTY